MRRRRTILTLLGILLLSLWPAVQPRIQAQGCGMGDLMCEINSLLEKTTDFINLEANFALHSTLYQFIHDAAVLVWGLWKALYSVGVGIGWIAEWIGLNLFQPMIQTATDMTRSVLSTVTFIALVVLGCTYVLSSIIRLRVVNPRNAFLWLLAIGLFFQMGPQLFSGMSDFRRAVNTFTLASATDALNGKNPFGKLTTDDPDKAGLSQMLTPCNNFTAYLPGAAGTTLNGLDIGLAYLRADGYDVLADGSRCSGVPIVALSTDLPRSWYQANGYFNLLMGPPTWHDGALTTEDKISLMKSSVQMAFASLARLLNDLPIAVFGIIEQCIGLCLVLAIGLVFISFSIAALFAFFERTEPIAWAVMDNWLSLIVQMFFIGLLQAVVLALYVSAASQATPSPLVTVALAWIGLFVFVMLLWSAVKAVWNAFNRLFEAVGTATRARVTPGETLVVGAQAGAALASGGMTLAGNLGGAALALGGGATWAQAAGVAMGSNRALDGAAWQLTRLPGVRNTMVGEVAEQFVEGSAAARAGQALISAAPGGGTLSRLGGAAFGTAFLTDRNRDHEQAYLDEQGQVYWQAPLLRNGMGSRVEGLTRGPAWDDEGAARIGRGGTIIEDVEGRPLTRHRAPERDTGAESPVPIYSAASQAPRPEPVSVSSRQDNTAASTSISSASRAQEDLDLGRAARYFRDSRGDVYREATDADGALEYWRLAARQPLSARQVLMRGEGVVTDPDNGTEYVRRQRQDGGYERQTWERVDMLPGSAQSVTRIALNAADTDIDEGVQRDVRNAVASSMEARGGGNDSSGAQRLDQATAQFGAAVTAAGDTLLRTAAVAARQQSQATQARQVGVNGAENVAEVLGRAIDAVRADHGRGGRETASAEQVSRALAGAVGMTAVSNTAADRNLRPAAAFVDKAVSMGISGAAAQQVLHDVKASPEGRLSPAARLKVVQQQRAAGQSWQTSLLNAQVLEATARQVPDTLVIYEARHPANAPEDAGVATTSVRAARRRYGRQPDRREGRIQ